MSAVGTKGVVFGEIPHLQQNRGPQLQRRPQLHPEPPGQVVVGQHRQGGTVNPVVAKNLSPGGRTMLNSPRTRKISFFTSAYSLHSSTDSTYLATSSTLHLSTSEAAEPPRDPPDGSPGDPARTSPGLLLRGLFTGGELVGDPDKSRGEGDFAATLWLGGPEQRHLCISERENSSVTRVFSHSEMWLPFRCRWRPRRPRSWPPS